MILLICLFAVGAFVALTWPKVADVCIRIAGVMVCGYAIVSIVRALMAG